MIATDFTDVELISSRLAVGMCWQWAFFSVRTFIRWWIFHDSHSIKIREIFFHSESVFCITFRLCFPISLLKFLFKRKNTFWIILWICSFFFWFKQEKQYFNQEKSVQKYHNVKIMNENLKRTSIRNVDVHNICLTDTFRFVSVAYVELFWMMLFDAVRECGRQRLLATVQTTLIFPISYISNMKFHVKLYPIIMKHNGKEKKRKKQHAMPNISWIWGW